MLKPTVENGGRGRLDRPAVSVGILLGLAAAIPGIPAFAGLPLRPWHLLVLAAFCLAVLSRPKGTIRDYRILAPEVILFFYVFSTGVTEFVNGELLGFLPDLPSLSSPLLYLAAYVSARLVCLDKHKAHSMFYGLAAPAPASAVIGILQAADFAGVNGFILMMAPGEGAINRMLDGSLTRSTAFVGHWTSLGIYLTCALTVLCILLIVESKTKETVPHWIVMSIALTFGGVISTLTVSAIITALIVLLVSLRLAGISFRYILMLVLSAAAALALLWPSLILRFEQQTLQSTQSVFQLPSWIPSTLTYRIGIWVTETLPAIGARPLIGWGQDAYDFTNGGIKSPDLLWLSAESQWLAILVSFGAPSFVVFVILISSVFTWLRRISDGRIIEFVPVRLLFILLLVVSLTAPIFTNRGAPGMIWPILGGCIAVFLSKNDSANMTRQRHVPPVLVGPYKAPTVPPLP